MNYLITGGYGFVGSNIASRLITSGNNVIVFDNLSRTGSSQNMKWLNEVGSHQFCHGDIRNYNDVCNVVAKFLPDVIFHLAGQVAMTSSVLNPRNDFEVNVLGSINILESIRNIKPDIVVVYSSSNKVYGDLRYLKLVESEFRFTPTDGSVGVSETVSLDFHTPYGCSKGAADQYMLDYARCYDLKTIVFRHSTIYGGRQFATYDQGWVGWFCEQALKVSKDASYVFTISGNGKQVRDLLYVDDAVDCYLKAALSKNSWGKAFNIGGGVSNSSSLIELFKYLENKLNIRLKWDELPWRHDDQKYFVADISKASDAFAWQPKVSKNAGVDKMLDWLIDK